MFCRLIEFRDCYFYLLLNFLYNDISAFNVDLSKAAIFNGINQSMFGFTVAAYEENGKSWILVGAPKNRDEYFSQVKRNSLSYEGYNEIYEGGSVYYCDVSLDKQRNTCSPIKFPTTQRFNENVYIERQGLGSSLVTSGSDGAVMICAPRVYTLVHPLFSYPIGACYYSEKGFTNFTKIYTQSNIPSYPLYGVEFGFSAAISKDSRTFYAGAVSVFEEVGENGCLIKVRGTRECYDAKNDSTHFGYAMTSLNLYGNGPEVPGVAVASPKLENLQGRVTIFTEKFGMSNSKILIGQQFGAFFGYSICTSDVDGDGADDLIIGAPLYSDNINSLSHFYENGRIYVYYQGKVSCRSMCWDKKFDTFNTIDGEHSKGRFGFAIASLGDINRDGFGDIAVSAPYEDWFENCPKDSCTGAVYIYHGSKQGIVKKYAQVIRASDIYNLGYTQKLSLKSFGSSLSGSLDLDSNSYPDLVVGAHESDTVFLFRSKPVISLMTNVSFSKSIIVLNEYSCKLKDETEVPCVDLKICLQYNGLNVERSINVFANITLDHQKATTEKRLFFYKNGVVDRVYRDEISLSLNENEIKCKEMTTYVARLRHDHDKLSPMEVLINCSLITPTNKNKDDPLPGILNNGLNVITTRDLVIQNNCLDNRCIPQLYICMKSNDTKFVLQPTDVNYLDLNVSVANQGEDSYNSIFKLKLPQGLSYSNVKNIESFENVSGICLPPTSDNNFTIVCNIGNPLPKGQMVNFTLTFEVDGSKVADSELQFLANVNCTNLELNPNGIQNSKKIFNISVVEVPNILINGSSSPSNILNISSYESDTITTDTQAGPILIHKYSIKNSGFSEIAEAIASFQFPRNSNSGEILLYFISNPRTQGPIECNLIDVNEANLKLEYSYQHLVKIDDSISIKLPIVNNQTVDLAEIDTRIHYGFGYCSDGTSIDSEEYTFYCNKERTHFAGRNGKINGTIDPAAGSIFTWTTGRIKLPENRSVAKKIKKSSDSTLIADTAHSSQPETVSVPTLRRIPRNIQVDDEFSTKQICSMGKCIEIQCVIKNLPSKQAVSVIFPSVVWAKTIRKMTNKSVVTMSSSVEINVTKLAGYFELASNTTYLGEVSTTIFIEFDLKIASIPWWIIIVSACIGILVFSGMAYVMYRVGFFKRNRPEKQLIQNE